MKTSHVKTLNPIFFFVGQKITPQKIAPKPLGGSRPPGVSGCGVAGFSGQLRSLLYLGCDGWLHATSRSLTGRMVSVGVLMVTWGGRRGEWAQKGHHGNQGTRVVKLLWKRGGGVGCWNKGINGMGLTIDFHENCWNLWCRNKNLPMLIGVVCHGWLRLRSSSGLGPTKILLARQDGGQVDKVEASKVGRRVGKWKCAKVVTFPQPVGGFELSNCPIFQKKDDLGHISTFLRSKIAVYFLYDGGGSPAWDQHILDFPTPKLTGQPNFPPPSRPGVDSAVGAESAESAKLLLEEGLPQETQAFFQGSRLNFQHQRKTKPEICGDFWRILWKQVNFL